MPIIHATIAEKIMMLKYIDIPICWFSTAGAEAKNRVTFVVFSYF